MARKKKSLNAARVFGDALFFIVALVCIVSMLLMYMNDRHKRASYDEAVRQAIENESENGIQSGKVLEDIVGSNEAEP